MNAVTLRVAEPTGMQRRVLRRYTFGTSSPCSGNRYGHNAAAVIGDVTEAEAEPVRGDNWPHDDQRWPQACAACGYEFQPGDQWQRNDDPVYRMPGGQEFGFTRSFGMVAPAGAIARIPWFDEHAAVPGESWIVALPDGGDWITTQRASGGGHWTVTGTVPHITVTPSIWHTSPIGWHGWIRDGVLVDA